MSNARPLLNTLVLTTTALLFSAFSFADSTPTPYVASDHYQVSAGGYHTCAIDNTGAHCWGNNSYGQTTVPTLTNPVMVSAGEYYTCALDDYGVHCWGWNGYGQTNVPTLTNPVTVSAGERHACAIDDNGVHCWGRNDWGQTNVPSLTHPIAVTAGGGHTCALDDNGVHCWGLDEYNQSTVPNLTHPIAVSGGGDHTCALDDNGVHCWGSNYNSENIVPSLTHPVAISVSNGHMCALDDSGAHCWGFNLYGQTNVPSLIHPVKISPGYEHTCAFDDNGVHCWGYNTSGQTTVPCLAFNSSAPCPTSTPTPTPRATRTPISTPTPDYTPTATPMPSPSGTPPTLVPGAINKTPFPISPLLTSSGSLGPNDDTVNLTEYGPSGRRIATNNAGLFLHVNNEKGNIYGQYVQNGFPSGFKFLIAMGATYDDMQEISVDMNNAGVAVVAWNNNGTIKAQIIPADTVILTPSPITLGAGEGISLSASINDAGDVGITWSNGQNVYLKTFDSAGNAKGDTATVSSACTMSNLTQQSIFDNSSSPASTCVAHNDMNNNGIVVVWNEQRNIYARRYDLNGVSVGNTFQVDNTPPDVGVSDTQQISVKIFSAFAPAVAMNNADSFAVVWHRLADNAKRVAAGYSQFNHSVSVGVVTQFFNASNVPAKKDSLGAPSDFTVVLDKNVNLSPEISMNNNNTFAIIWQNQINKKLKVCVSYQGQKGCSSDYFPIISVNLGLFVPTTATSGIKKSGTKQVAKGVNTSPLANKIMIKGMAIPAVSIDDAGRIETQWVLEDFSLDIVFTSLYDYYVNYQLNNTITSRYYPK